MRFLLLLFGEKFLLIGIQRETQKGLSTIFLGGLPKKWTLCPNMSCGSVCLGASAVGCSLNSSQRGAKSSLRLAQMGISQMGPSFSRKTGEPKGAQPVLESPLLRNTHTVCFLRVPLTPAFFFQYISNSPLLFCSRDF